MIKVFKIYPDQRELKAHLWYQETMTVEALNSLQISHDGLILRFDDEFRVIATRFCSSQSNYTDGQCMPCPASYGTLFF